MSFSSNSPLHSTSISVTSLTRRLPLVSISMGVILFLCQVNMAHRLGAHQEAFLIAETASKMTQQDVQFDSHSDKTPNMQDVDAVGGETSEEAESTIPAQQSHLSLGDAYQEALKTSTVADPSLPTVAFFGKSFYSGFRNEAMSFTFFVMEAMDKGYQQILLPTIRWKDLFGSNKGIPHENLFDVVHWNSFFPQLPKLVYHHSAFSDYDATHNQWTVDNPEANATMPYVYGRQMRLIVGYMRYTRRIQQGQIERHAAELTMIRGAFKPHPELQAHIDRLHRSMSSTKYMCLHARVEPDMQVHTPCQDKKVRSLKDILKALEAKFPDPPLEQLFIAVFRPMLEQEVAKKDSKNRMAAENLAELNRVRKEGMWGGKVKVYEGGTPTLVNTSFENCSSIAGSIVNYFLSIGADQFIGTEVSSFSMDVMSSRFYRGNRQNYVYLPEGIVWATPPNATAPPRFKC